MKTDDQSVLGSAASASPGTDLHVEGWQPIETAQKDARAIVTDGHYVERGYLWPHRQPVWTDDADGTKLRPQPTHWMPLPAPPKAKP